MRMLKTCILFILCLWLTLLAYNTVFPPISTLMAARALTLRSVERKYVPLSKISPHLMRAVIVAEDSAYCQHNGIDWKALHGVARDVIEEDDTSHGGSTIAMQTAKNLFLWMDYPYLRKPLEIPFALMIDAVWSKRLLMENYLNVAEFGKDVFGAEAASRRYFRKSAKHLNAREAALLAAILPSPRRRSASRPSPFVSRYAASIQGRMGGADTQCLRR